MSASLMWRPISKSESLAKGLCMALQKGEEVSSISRIVDEQFIPFLMGLVCADIEGAQELINIIEKYERVEIYLQF